MMPPREPPVIGVVGLWHLGCTIAACWAELGCTVRGVDLDHGVVGQLRQGQPPIYEPGLSEAVQLAVQRGTLSFSTTVDVLAGCQFVFVAYDTPVRDDDTSDLSTIEEMVSRMARHLDREAIVIVSAQLPAGTARRLRGELKKVDPSLELVYSPENLRLGEAMACYRLPGHIVIGSDSKEASSKVERLFAPMSAECLHMNLPSAEMAKHGINSFLAASITLANQWADLCSVIGADFRDMAEAMRHDPRIGKRAYLSAGIGFSGGTLGRDLRVLESLSDKQARGGAPIFGEVWRYNNERFRVVRKRCEEVIASVKDRTIALLGMTYKPGTSTLRRSLPLEVARDLGAHGARLRVFDPKADWKGVSIPSDLTVCGSPYDAVSHADLLIFLTEWPEFLRLDFNQIKATMAQPILFDTKDMLRAKHGDLEQLGFRLITIGRNSS